MNRLILKRAGNYAYVPCSFYKLIPLQPVFSVFSYLSSQAHFNPAISKLRLNLLFLFLIIADDLSKLRTL